eukprot:COSAG01_NODE_26702_length_705_cov_2.613861_2_plen_33_part_01
MRSKVIHEVSVGSVGASVSVVPCRWEMGVSDRC